MMRALQILLPSMAAVASFGTPAAAQPLICGSPDDAARTDGAPVSPQALAGTYRCIEEGLTTTLRLGADGRFDFRIAANGVEFSEAERAELEKDTTRTGRWRVDGGTLILFEKPMRAPVIKLVETAHDPSVWMRVEMKGADGRPVEGIFIGYGPDANPRSDPVEGVVDVPRSYTWEPVDCHIVRRGDDLKLASFTPSADGNNVFRYVYQPSEVEPFEIRAGLMGNPQGAIVMPLGTGGVVLRRTDGR